MKRFLVSLVGLGFLVGCNKQFETIKLPHNSVINEGSFVFAELGTEYNVKVSKIGAHAPENCFFDTFSTRLDNHSHRLFYDFLSMTCGSSTLSLRGYAIGGDEIRGLRVDPKSGEPISADYHFKVKVIKDAYISDIELVIKEI
ncbi:hypothetical protein NMR92_003290 [Vibrio cholerae]|uniref:hypothetical protein n=1 Tax=Vibrio parahaemolyticus TaxID=670 RepID=UPI00155D9DDF|nr:hypothetical protein [Vibrio parahaemolyticus]EJL6492328.1 hypothetical protein [Vibrio cholerae]EJL6644132.1 hypothetical protein [Vibrio cholerae]MCI9702155.1 hypothetical protein [Vibrio parahaemolyticus]MCR9815048.1 hypothetical protein [Vibrio parahaemolyticus]MDF4316670.1 hypothetical protein [Vibrio parahaemolyticus]